jgi:hypothetical protein
MEHPSGDEITYPTYFAAFVDPARGSWVFFVMDYGMLTHGFTHD